MKYLVLSLTMLLSIPAMAQDVACPDGYICLSTEDYAQVYEKLQQLEVIEEGQPTITFTDPWVIITDRSGRVYSNGTGDDTPQIRGSVSWGHMSADLVLKPQVSVRRREEPNFGVRLRPKAIGSYLILQTDLKDPLAAVDAGVDIDFAYAYRFNLSGYIGARSLGGDLGMDVFKNSGVALGAHWTWPSNLALFVFSPSIGWYFAF